MLIFPGITPDLFFMCSADSLSMGVIENPVTEPFIIVIVTGLAVVILSIFLARMWGKVTKSQNIFLLISGPGIIIHECAHVMGCIITGARIKKIVLLSKEGGMVVHTEPALPLFGTVIISIAPLILLPLTLVFLTWFFGTYAGCSFPPFETSPGLSNYPVSLFSFAGEILFTNIIAKFNAWFFLYIYFVVSLALSFAPSGRDLRNAAFGLILLIGLVFVCVAVDIAVVNSAFLIILGFMQTAFSLAAGFEIVALCVSLPLYLVFRG